MEFRAYRGRCLCSLGGAFPADAQRVETPFFPLLLLVRREMLHSRGYFAVNSIGEALQAEDASALLPAKEGNAPELLREFVQKNGASVLNTAFPRAWEALTPREYRRVTLVGLGDVGGGVLTALKLLGTELSEIAIYDPNEALCRRYELELNQVLSADDKPLPRVTVCDPARLFDCDLFLFTASRGVPPVGSEVRDVRMAQFDLNRQMLRSYARQAREAHFSGLFCQISDPVDQLSRAVFLDSNTNDAGNFDGNGLLPEQIRGFGLGVMAARAAYYAEKTGIDFRNGRVYGPHGGGLLVANDPLAYDPAVSERLAALTVTANLRVRELGFKPYIAPALSSAAVSLLRLLRGLPHYSAVPMGSAYFGCVSRMTERGIEIRREALDPRLFAHIEQTLRGLEEFDYA